MDVSSSDSDEEDLLKYGAVSPKVRTNVKYLNSGRNELFIKSNLKVETSEDNLDLENVDSSPINKITEKDSNLESSKNQVTADSDSDDSDFEIDLIEKGIQVSAIVIIIKYFRCLCSKFQIDLKGITQWDIHLNFAKFNKF